MNEVTAIIFNLFDKYGHEDYLGEKVTQTEHAIQCAMAAERENAPVPTILGSFLHDIGHLIGQEQKLNNMVTGTVTLGIETHDKVGEEFLKALGVPAEVYDFASGHVRAKRYLTYKDTGYYSRLSDASKMTLVHQGGPMTEDEASQFEKHPRFQQILKMRTWDEAAKVEHLEMDPLDKYRSMFHKYMGEQC